VDVVARVCETLGFLAEVLTTQFTCFTGTKVQILTLLRAQDAEARASVTAAGGVAAIMSTLFLHPSSAQVLIYIRILVYY
jgi:hypothetical protein